MTALQDALVRCYSCGRTTSWQEDPPAMCPECQGFQRIVRLG
ncbi:hypothetical protein M201_gp50 [Haloarcula californiae tailed virus 2]|uniref:Rubrerythrin-like domain-containing protein n=1 Tax=Haloarcula californiae tailed virus 2 TaxID=1273747 RepID=R4T7R8_9CAUD|nr:hypothetical protein M201_gp50 [Haloarcula californiae tailed virus 2]AGM11819.1 hypothetical protein HCTV2_49 [Haloarcula californiae tailed virus 2]